MRGWLWGALAAASASLIVALALTGQRPSPGLVPFQAAGLMVDIAPHRVRDVEIHGPHGSRRFARRDDGRWTRTDGEAAAGDLHERIEAGLKFLHVTAVERTLSPEEVPAPADFGLEPPRVTVVARAEGAAAFTIHFGGTNPLGLARYARVEPRADVVLLPAHAADAWDQVAAAP